VTNHFLFVFNTNLHQISRTVSAGYCRSLVIFSLSTRWYTLVQREALNSGPRNLASRN